MPAKRPGIVAAQLQAEKIDLKLRADDRRFDGDVYMKHHDGSSFLWKHAFVRKWKGFWMIFTEHHLRHVYDHEEVMFLSAGAPLRILHRGE